MKHSESIGITYDCQNERFILMNLNEEDCNDLEQSYIPFRLPTNRHAKCIAIRSANSDSLKNENLFQLLIAEEQRLEAKEDVSLLSIEIDKTSARLIEKCSKKIEKCDSDEWIFELEMVENSVGRLWVVAIWHFKGHRKRTFFQIYALIDDKADPRVGGENKPELKFVGKACRSGIWRNPFVGHETIFLLPQILDDKQAKLDRFLPVNFEECDGGLTVVLESNSGNYPSRMNSKWSRSCAGTNERVAFYVFNEVLRTGEIWVLNWHEKIWSLCFELKTHPIHNNMSLCFSGYRNLLLHGECIEESCEDHAHVYSFPFDTIICERMTTMNNLLDAFKKNAGLKLSPSVQSKVGPKKGEWGKLSGN